MSTTWQKSGAAEGTAEARHTANALIALAQPALDEADRMARRPPMTVTLRYWASPLTCDVRHVYEDGTATRVCRVFVTNEQVAEAFAQFLNAGLEQLPHRDRLRVIAKAQKSAGWLSLVLDVDATFGGVTGLLMSFDESQRVELFRLTELPH